MKLINYYSESSDDEEEVQEPFIIEPIGTKWTGIDYKSDFFKTDRKFTITYLKNNNGIAKFVIANKERKIPTAWRDSCHEYFFDRYKLVRKEIPMDIETKNQIFIYQYIKILFAKMKLPVDIENIVCVFLGCKMNLLQKKII